jgi:hypothetical protein
VTVGSVCPAKREWMQDCRLVSVVSEVSGSPFLVRQVAVSGVSEFPFLVDID